MFRRVWRPTALLVFCAQLLAAPALADPNAAGRSAAGVFETLIKLLVSPGSPRASAPAERPPPPRARPRNVVRATQPAPKINPPIVAARRSTGGSPHDGGSPHGAQSPILIIPARAAPALQCNAELVVCDGAARRSPMAPAHPQISVLTAR
jgi:hypothetical protein